MLWNKEDCKYWIFWICGYRNGLLKDGIIRVYYWWKFILEKSLKLNI